MQSIRKIDKDIRYLSKRKCSFGAIIVDLASIPGVSAISPCKTNTTGKTICKIKLYGEFLKEHPGGDLHLTIFENDSTKPHVTFYPIKDNNVLVYHYGVDENHPRLSPWGNGKNQDIKDELKKLFIKIFPKIVLEYPSENISVPLTLTPLGLHMSHFPSTSGELNKIQKLLLKRTMTISEPGKENVNPSSGSGKANISSSSRAKLSLRAKALGEQINSFPNPRKLDL